MRGELLLCEARLWASVTAAAGHLSTRLLGPQLLELGGGGGDTAARISGPRASPGFAASQHVTRLQCLTCEVGLVTLPASQSPDLPASVLESSTGGFAVISSLLNNG